MVINFFDNAHRVSVSEDLCDDCGAHIVDVDFSKVRLYTYLLGSRATFYQTQELKCCLKSLGQKQQID